MRDKLLNLGIKENDGADYVVVLEQSDHPVSTHLAHNPLKIGLQAELTAA